MKKITLKFENEYYGKFDTIQKEIDCEFQAGNASSSDELQAINVVKSFCVSVYDFAEKLGIDASLLRDYFNVEYNTFSNLEEEEPENNFEEAGQALDLNLDFDSFLKQFNSSVKFQKMIFDMFQEYMDDDE